MSTRGKDSVDEKRRKPRVADKAARDRARSLSAKLIAARGNQGAGTVGYSRNTPGSSVPGGSRSRSDGDGGGGSNRGSASGDGSGGERNERNGGRDTPGATTERGDQTASASAEQRGAESREEIRHAEVPARVASPEAPPSKPKKLPRLAVTPPQEITRLDEKMIAGGYRTLFSLPALAGYGKHWELDDFDVKVLTEPTARMAANLSPATSKLLAKILDPITVLGALGMLIAARMEMTKVYLHELKIQREIEVKRAALSRVVEETSRGHAGAVVSPNSNGEPTTTGTPSAAGGKAGTKDLFA